MNQPQRKVLPLVNRIPELRLVTDRLEILHGRGAVFQCVINFYGILGVGKTTLLEHLNDYAQSGNWPHAQIPPTLSALVDLSAQRSWPHILGHIAEQLQERTGLVGHQLQSGLKTLCSLSKPDPRDEAACYTYEQEARKVAAAFNRYVYEQAKQSPVLLLLDNTEALEEEVFYWLEYEVFSPLVQTDRLLLVVAGSSPVHWKRFEVRRRVLLRKLLPPQDARDAEQLVRSQAPSWSLLAPNIIQLTFGYPLANQAVVEKLENLGEAERIDAQVFSRYREDLLRHLLADVVEGKLLAAMPTELRQTFRLVAPLRQFDVTTLQSLLPQVAPDNFANRTENYFVSLCNRMVATRLAEWDAGRKAYVLDETLRRFLLLELETYNRAQALQIHEAASALYRRWFEESSSVRSTHVVEWLYHRIQALRLKGEDVLAIRSTILEEFENILNLYYRPSEQEKVRQVDRARSLLEELKRDTDLTDDLIGEGTKDLLLQMVERVNPESTTG